MVPRRHVALICGGEEVLERKTQIRHFHFMKPVCLILFSLFIWGSGLDTAAIPSCALLGHLPKPKG